MIVDLVSWQGPTIAISGHLQNLVARPTQVTLIVNGIDLISARVNSSGHFHVTTDVPSGEETIYLVVQEANSAGPIPLTKWEYGPYYSPAIVAGTGAPKKVLRRSLKVKLSYSEPTVDAIITIPRSDKYLRQFLAGSMPPKKFYYAELSGMRLNHVLLADALSNKPTSISFDTDNIIIHVGSSPAAINFSRLDESLPTLSGPIAFSIDENLDSVQRMRYIVHDDLTVELQDFEVRAASLPKYTIDHTTGQVMQWHDPFGPRTSEPSISVNFPAMASAANFLQLASNTPSEYISNRDRDVDSIWAGGLAILPVFAWVIVRPRFSALGSIVFGAAILSPVATTLCFNYSGIVSLRSKLVVIALAFVIASVAFRLKTFGLAKLCGTLAASVGLALSYGVAVCFFISFVEARWDPSGPVAIAAVLVVTSIWTSTVMFAFDYVAGRAIINRGLASWIIVCAVSALAIPISIQPISDWNSVYPGIETPHFLVSDLQSILGSIVPALFGLAVCIRIARSRLSKSYKATAEAGFLFIWFCSAYSATVFMIPVGAIIALFVFRYLLWSRVERRMQIDSSRNLVIYGRRRLLDEAREAFLLRRLAAATETLEKLYKTQKLKLSEWQERSRDLEGLLTQSPRRYFGRTATELALSFGPDAVDRKNALLAVKIGLSFSTIDVLLGLPDILGQLSHQDWWEYSLFSWLAQSVSAAIMFVPPSFFFGYYFRYIRGSTGLFKGLLMGGAVTIIMSVGWLVRVPRPITFVVWVAEWLLMFATIGIAFDALSLRKVYGRRFRIADVGNFSGLPGLAAFTTILVTAFAGATSEIIKGEFVSLASLAAGLTPTMRVAASH